jgi:hypothetical protein
LAEKKISTIFGFAESTLVRKNSNEIWFFAHLFVPLQPQTFQNDQTTKQLNIMYWTLELASKLEDAPWPATKEELIDYATRSGAPLEVIENLEEIEDEGDIYESIEEIWPDYPSKEDFLWDEEEY